MKDEAHAVGWTDWPEDVESVSDLVAAHNTLLTRLADTEADRLLLSRRVGMLRGELWTLRHLASRRHVMSTRAVVQRIDRILDRDQQAAS